jgi:predicted RNase H-like nuclease (RuvC/YqgF family)
VDPLYIEDTDDWLGNPEPLETCRHQLRMYENEFEALTLQLARALENVQGLVQVNDAITQELDSLRSQLTVAKAETADASRRASEIEIRSNWILMAKDKHISELDTRLKALKGESPFGNLPSPPQRDNSLT